MILYPIDRPKIILLLKFLAIVLAPLIFRILIYWNLKVKNNFTESKSHYYIRL